MAKQYNVTLEHLPKLAKQLASHIRGGEVLALIGPLGAGKTTFVKQLAQELGVRATVTSPTFTLMHEYQTKGNRPPLLLYHLDLYRTTHWKEVVSIGITEMWGRPGTVTLIEWADKIKRHLPAKTITILFSYDTET